MAETFCGVVIDKAHRLHKGITYRWSAIFKPCLLQGLAHGYGLGGIDRHLAFVFPAVLHDLAVDKTPDKVLK